MSNRSNSSGGVGVAGLLGVAFVVLKLMGVINWSWWWVTCPFWIGLAVVLGIGAIALVALLITMAVKRPRKMRLRHGASASLVLALLLTGCGTIKYGDGRIGSVSISPAVEQLAKAADSQFPGSGAKIREYYSTAAIDRVPVGYTVRWTAYLDGKQINEAAIVRVPTLAPVAGSPVVAPPTDGDETASLLEFIGVLPSGSAATGPGALP